MNNQEERRKNPRLEAEWPIRIIRDDFVIEGESRNISIDGIQICCEQPLHMNEKIRITIFPPNSEEITFIGEVAWSDFYGLDDDNKVFGIGVCMVEVDEENKNLICNFLKERLNKEDEEVL